jgi:AcrR family transcriptional regulator
MSVERIAEAAIAVADADGLVAVSMQRVAGELGFTKMALYRYVPGKTELVALMADVAIGGPPALTGAPHDWRTRLTDWAHHLLAAFLHHPWLLGATVGPRIMGPNELGWMEVALAALAATGLNGGERLDTVAVVAGHIRSMAQQVGATDRPEAALSSPLVALMSTHGERYPELTAALASTTTQGGQDEALDFGLHAILDGIGLLVARRAEGPAATTS